MRCSCCTSFGFQLPGFGHGCVVMLEPDGQGGISAQCSQRLSSVTGSTIFERIEGKSRTFRHGSSPVCSGLFSALPVAKQGERTVQVGEPAKRNRQTRKSPTRPAHKGLAVLRTQKNRAVAVSAVCSRSPNLCR